MSDKVKCKPKKCPLKNKCWRYVDPLKKSETWANLEEPDSGYECAWFNPLKTKRGER